MPSRFKKYIFVTGVLLSSFLIIEVGIRVISVTYQILNGDINAFVDPINPVPVFELKNQNDKAIYRRTKHHLILTSSEFIANKEKNTYRVFILGGSAAAGFP